MDPSTGRIADAPAVTGLSRKLDRLAALGQDAAMQIRELTEKMPGGFFIYSACGEEKLLYANAALLGMFGCENAEQFEALTGNSFRGMVHPGDLEDVEESIRRQITDSSSLDYVEYRIIRRDGAVRWVEDYGHFSHNEAAGDLFYVFLADATDKHLAQQAILGQKDRELEALSHEQTQSLEIIQGLSVDYESIFYLDLEADLIRPYRMSRRVAEQVKGLSLPCPFKQFAKGYVESYVVPEDRERMLRAFSSQYLRERLSRRGTYHITYRVEGESGDEYLQLRCVNVEGAEQAGRIVMGVRLVDSEIVLQLDQKRLLEEALQRAQAAEIARNTFLANMSHDIRTPMNAIMGLASLVRTCAGDPERVLECVDRIEAAGKDLLSLLSNVLELSQLESGKTAIEEHLCSLADVMADVKEKISACAAEKNLALTVDLSGMTHSGVYGDYDRLVQTLLCLASNAVNYTPAGGAVKLSLEEEPREMQDYSVYRFRVEDTGVGISPEFMKRIYEPFERERNTTLSGVQGTGLGLPIAKGLVDLMGGTLEAESTPGQGSVFTVTLSMRLDRPKPQKKAGAVSRDFTGMKVLLVDDNDINIIVESALLRKVGFTLDVAKNGRIAVDKIRQSAPGDYQLILMDIQMPVMDGREATRAIRALEDPALSGIPIVAVSANALDTDVRQSLECGMEAHLPKPLSVPELLEQIDQIVGEKQA